MKHPPTLRGEDMLREPEDSHPYTVSTMVKTTVFARSHEEAIEQAEDRIKVGWLPGITQTHINSSAQSYAERQAGQPTGWPPYTEEEKEADGTTSTAAE